MSALQGAVESTAPVSRLHAHRSEFPVPTGREERMAVHAGTQFSEGDHIRPAAVAFRATRPAAHLCVWVLGGSCTGLSSGAARNEGAT
jgi:hypothetical protein